MFLKALQYKSSKKVLAKILDSTVTKEVNSNLVKTVGIIVNGDATENIKEILDGLKLTAKIEVLCYHKEFKKTRILTYPVFYEKDFGWKGKPKSADLKQFLETPHDLLISYYSQNKVPLLLVSGLHTANFKVGIAGSDQQIHDLIIQTKETEIAAFAKELHRYLHILNKL